MLLTLVILIVPLLAATPPAQRGATPPMALGDKSRALVPGLQVTVNLETQANVGPHSTITDQEGRFRFTGLPLGSYCLTVHHRGSGVTMRTGIRVRGAQATNIPIVLGEPSPTPTPDQERACGRKNLSV
jgi:hypothetical protein